MLTCRIWHYKLSLEKQKGVSRMEENNICRFIPYQNSGEQIRILHYVLETKRQNFESFKCISMYRMHLVTQGEGYLHTPNGSHMLSAGDIFFCMPAVLYAIESGADFQYVYIGYLGAHANAIMDKLKITGSNCIFHGFSGLCDFWLEGLHANPNVADLRSESVLLYTFSVLGDAFFENDKLENQESSVVLQIRKYIEDHLSDTELSLVKISKELMYHQKYLSAVFKSVMRVGISEYITTLRIQQACTLMNQGFTSSKDIAFLCGYNDPLYFSKVFKARIGVSPREYQRQITK